MSIAIPLDDLTKAKMVSMILNKKTEAALQHLSKFYGKTPPEIVVGTIKGKRKTVYAVYVQKESKNLCNKLRYLLQSFCSLTRILLSSYADKRRYT
jgi:hypothetical protein